MSGVPEPVIEVAIEPKTRADQEKMVDTLNHLAQGDPSFGFVCDAESGQTLIKGTSELHLEAIVDRIKREFGVEANVGAPQVAYRETITRAVEQDYTHDRRTGGPREYAKVKIRFEPLPAGSGFKFENWIGDGRVPKGYVLGVETGLNAVKEQGTIAGFPMIDFKAALIDGEYHDVDSSALTFDIAVRACYREGIPKAGPRLLEPIMLVEVVTPEDCLGDIIGDLNSRQGQVGTMDTRGSACVIGAMVPMANMFDYGWTLRVISRDRATYAMRFDHYAAVPRSSPPDDGPAMAMRA